MSDEKQRADEAARKTQEEKRLTAERAAARLRARDVTQRLSAQAAAKTRKATGEAQEPRISWQSIVITVLIVVVVIVLAYAGVRMLTP